MTIQRTTNGQFAKGHEKKGGKQKGYESPINKEFRSLMAEFTKDGFEDFVEAWAKCEPRDKCAIYLKALEFNLPKLQNVTLDNGEAITNSLTEKLIELSKM